LAFSRVHVNALGSGATFDILVQSVYPSAVDQLGFTQAATITRTITSSDGAPTFLTNFADDMGPFVQVSIRGNQSAGAVVIVQAQLSIGLLVRQSN
jgi:hypothetical protein